jgi:putative oxidoreductase
MSTLAAVIGRILIALLFVVSGILKLADPGVTAGMLQSAGLSPAYTVPVALFEIVLGLALAIGAMTRLASLLLAGFTVLTVLFFHHDFYDPAKLPTILLHVAVVGGLLGVFAHSQIWWSYDSLRRRRAEDLARHDRDATARVHEAEVRAARAEGRVEGHVDPALPPVTDPTPRRKWF